MRGLVEAKKKLQLFSEVIEYLDDQAKEARKAVFNKNNQIGNYVNQVRQLEHEITELSKRVGYELF
jgi:peptidoglycan hydrolase CwlO-like protein